MNSLYCQSICMKITVKREKNFNRQTQASQPGRSPGRVRNTLHSVDKKEKIARRDGTHPSSQSARGRGRQISVSWRSARATWWEPVTNKEKNGEREGRGERKKNNRTQGSNSNSTDHSNARSRLHTHLQAFPHYHKRQEPKCSGWLAKDYMLHTSPKFLATSTVFDWSRMGRKQQEL